MNKYSQSVPAEMPAIYACSKPGGTCRMSCVPSFATDVRKSVQKAGGHSYVNSLARCHIANDGQIVSVRLIILHNAKLHVARNYVRYLTASGMGMRGAARARAQCHQRLSITTFRKG